jgi:hypothetical protein
VFGKDPRLLGLDKGIRGDGMKLTSHHTGTLRLPPMDLKAIGHRRVYDLCVLSGCSRYVIGELGLRHL